MNNEVKDNQEYFPIKKDNKEIVKKEVTNQNNNSNDKKSNTLEIGLLVLIIYDVISLLLMIKVNNGFKLAFLIYLYNIIILFIGYRKAKEKKSIATKIGILIGIYLLLGNIISIILGIFTIIDSVNYNKQLNGKSDKKNEWLVIPIIIIGYIVLIATVFIINNSDILNHELKCVRNNKDKIVYYFDETGIKDITKNGESDEEELDNITEKYHGLIWYYSEKGEKIEKYKDLAKHYEEVDLGSKCSGF